jgi:hypothetical protein
VRSEVLTAISMKMAVFWELTVMLGRWLHSSRQIVHTRSHCRLSLASSGG